MEINALLKLTRIKRSGVIISRVKDLLDSGYDSDFLVNEFLRIDQAVWGHITEDARFLRTKEIIRKNFQYCPETICCVFEKNTVVATITWIRLNEASVICDSSWFEKTGGGTLETHNPLGNVVLGVDLSVLRTVSRSLADQLLLTAIAIGPVSHGSKSVYLGSRIPSFHKYPDLSVGNYVYGKRKSGKPLDPELYFYLKNGFKIAGIIPNYMDDPKSLNYGVMVRWDNPLYKLTKIFPPLKYLIRKIGEKFLLGLPDIK